MVPATRSHTMRGAARRTPADGVAAVEHVEHVLQQRARKLGVGVVRVTSACSSGDRMPPDQAPRRGPPRPALFLMGRLSPARIHAIATICWARTSSALRGTTVGSILPSRMSWVTTAHFEQVGAELRPHGRREDHSADAGRGGRDASGFGRTKPGREGVAGCPHRQRSHRSGRIRPRSSPAILS